MRKFQLKLKNIHMGKAAAAVPAKKAAQAPPAKQTQVISKVDDKKAIDAKK